MVFETLPNADEPHNCILCNCIFCNCIFQLNKTREWVRAKLAIILRRVFCSPPSSLLLLWAAAAKTYKRKWYCILQISFEIIRWQCPQRNKSLFQRTFLDLWKWYSFHLQSDPRLSAKNSKTSFMVGCLALYFPPFSRSEIFLVQDQQSLEVIFVQNWEKWKKQQKAMQYLNLFMRPASCVPGKAMWRQEWGLKSRTV